MSYLRKQQKVSQKRKCDKKFQYFTAPENVYDVKSIIRIQTTNIVTSNK